MSDSESLDSIAPWTIKAISSKTREVATTAARKEGITVGQWLEKRVSEWLEAGSPISIPLAPATAPQAPAGLAELAQLIDATRQLAEAAKVPVPSTLAREAFAALRSELRKGKPAPAPRARLALAAPEPARDPARVPARVQFGTGEGPRLNSF